MTKILHIVGARPNFVKVAPLIHELKKYPQFSQVLVHTGQHFDNNMSSDIFLNLCIPQPDENLSIGPGLPIHQLSLMIDRLGMALKKHTPDLVIVYGDVTSTLAGAITARQSNCQLVHVESGLRSYDREMPEEINRIVVDHLSDLLFTSSIDASNHLLLEGIRSNAIYFVGNIMIDSLVQLLPKTTGYLEVLRKRFSIPDRYVLVTLHREYLLKHIHVFDFVMETLNQLAKTVPVVFPVHPHTAQFLTSDVRNILLLPPLDYLNFITLEKNARFVITDSGGIQEETSYLGVRCVTLRKNTERPITITDGTNILVDPETPELLNILAGIDVDVQPANIQYWDGQTAQRIVDIICNKF